MDGGEPDKLRQIDFEPNLKKTLDADTEYLVWQLMNILILQAKLQQALQPSVINVLATKYKPDDSASLFSKLGFETMSVDMQWQAITRMALIGIITGEATYKGRTLPLEDIYPEVTDFKQLEPTIVVSTDNATFTKYYKELSHKYLKYECALIKRGLALLLKINDFEAEIRRFHQDEPLDRLFNYVLINSPSRTVSRGELENTDGHFIDKVKNLNSLITNSKLDAIRPFLVVVNKDEIHVEPHIQLSRQELEVLLQKISENLRKPFVAYLAQNKL
jgi:hypothetical protein